jgi:hypothetical protein
MHKIVPAESLLALVMPPDRAAATVGDLVESSHDPLEFWWSLLGTATRATFAQLTVRTTLTAVVLSILLDRIFTSLFTALLVYVDPPKLPLLMPDLGFLLLTPVLAGYLMGRVLPGHELGGAAAALFLVCCGAGAVWWIGPTGVPGLVIALVVPPPIDIFPLLLGASLARRGALRRQGAIA